jgi:hypothetical protein
MSNNEKTNGFHALKVSNFDHSSTIPCATRWREWVVKLRYAFGSAYPLLVNQTSEVLDPLKYWWGLTWSPLLDFDGTHEKQIITDHDPVQLVEKLKAKYTVECPGR